MPSVAVLVELAGGPRAGGHLKCWERFAEAATRLSPSGPGIDLTVYVLGSRERVEPWSPRVRFITLRPLLGTAPLGRGVGGADATDLAPYHPALARLLPRHDVWHLTHVFAFAATATRLARRRRRGAAAGGRSGLVGSVHTDVPALTAAYVRRLTGAPHLPRTADGASGLPEPPGLPNLSDLAALPGAAGPPDRPHPVDAPGLPAAPGLRQRVRRSPEALAAALVRRRRDRLLRACDRVLVATPSQRAEIAAVVGADRVSLLGRGIDRARFRSDPAAGARLRRAHGIPEDRTAVLFVGRVDASKRALLLAEAVRRLRNAGHPVHLVVVGSGPDTAGVSTLLGPDATLLGPLPQERLAGVYAGCDVFAFPSRTETAGNVVAEAMACALPVVLPAGARTTGWLARPGWDGLTVADDAPESWAAALAPLVDRPGLRAELGARAAGTAREHHRSWDEVLAEDLLPLWLGLARARSQG